MDFVTEDYREHVLFVHAHKSTVNVDRFLGSFIASKDGSTVAQATIDSDFDDSFQAKRDTLQIAKECVDELLMY